MPLVRNRIVKRIIRSYLAEKKTASDLSLLWQWIIDSKFLDIISKIRDNEIGEVRKALDEFASSNISYGLSLSFANSKKLCSLVVKWKEITGLDIKVLKYPEKYGFKLANIAGIKTIPIAPRMSYFAQKITNLSDGNIVEIGGGYCGVAYHLFRDFDFKRTYINFDIPEVLLLSKYFLLNEFPHKKILLFGEDGLNNFESYDIVLMPHYEIEKFKENGCDIVINLNSLSEMSLKSVLGYLKQIDRISKKYFLHSNHDEQARLTSEWLQCSEEPFNLSKLELPNDRWERKYRVSQPLCEMGDSVGLSYWEYLYQRRQKQINVTI